MQIKLLSIVSALTLISGCTGLSEKVVGRYNETDTKATRLVNHVGQIENTVKAGASVIHEDGVWIGKNVVKLDQHRLPPIFSEPVIFDRPVTSLSELTERITLRSGIPTKISPDALSVAKNASASGIGVEASAASTTTTPVSTNSVARPNQTSNSDKPILINFSNGNFKAFLDTVASRFGVFWKYTDGTIQFYYTDSRTFQINAIPGDSALTATVASGATSTGGDSGGGSASGVSSSNNQNTAVNSKLSVFANIEKAIEKMLSSVGKVVASPSTGSVTVVDTPDSLNRIAKFIENENKTLSRQVMINVTVLSVVLNNNDSYGVDWNLVYNNLATKYGITNQFTSTLANPKDRVAFSAGVLSSNSNWNNTTAIIKALSDQGKVRRETTASVVTLNNQPVPVQVAKQTAYLKSSATTVTQTTSTTTLTPGSVTSGFNMSILPHILNNGLVMLQFSTDMSSLIQIKTVDSGTGTVIQTPELDSRNFLQRVSMRSNETLVISGFEQTEDSLAQQGVGKPSFSLLGGGYTAKTSKETIVILITPITMGAL